MFLAWQRCGWVDGRGRLHLLHVRLRRHVRRQHRHRRRFLPTLPAIFRDQPHFAVRRNGYSRLSTGQLELANAMFSETVDPRSLASLNLGQVLFSLHFFRELIHFRKYFSPFDLITRRFTLKF